MLPALFRRPRLLLLAALLWSVFGTDLCTAAEKVLTAAAYAADITPLKFPVSSNGQMQDRMVSRVHDPLHARCLVLDDGKTRIAIIVSDSCMIPREVIDTAKTKIENLTGIPVNQILISATHTHTAVSLAGVFQSEPAPGYAEFYSDRVAEGVAQAIKQLVPARIGWGVGKNPTQVFNRRWKLKPGAVGNDPFGRGTDRARMNPGYGNPDVTEPAGPIDPDVSIVAVQTTAGQPIAVLANYSLHYVGSGVPGDSLSADYFAAFADRMTQLLHATDVKPAFVGIMSNGTSGDINNVNYSLPKSPMPAAEGQYKVVADSVARTAFDVYEKLEFHNWVPLAVREQELELKVRKPTAEELTKAEELIAAAPGGKLTTAPQIYARESVLIHKFPDTVKLRLQAIRIGELGIAAIPCEVFAEIGLAIKQHRTPAPTFTIELANGYNGYLPTPEQHALGGYETWRARSSYLEVDASVKIQAVLNELLKDAAK